MRRGLAALSCAAVLVSVLVAWSTVPSHTAESARRAGTATQRSPAVVPTKDLQPNDGPNILVVTTDDMRWDELRYVPNVRRYVVRRGLRFANSFAPNPLCCPSRAS